MRWSQLFADLEGQIAAESSRAFEWDVAELTRAERAGVELAARLRADRGREVTVMLRDGEPVTGELVDGAVEWLLVAAQARQHLVPTAAVSSYAGLSGRLAPLGEVERRLSLGSALRVLSRDRRRVVVHTDAGQLGGLLGPVAADHVEVVLRVGEAPLVVPFGAIVQVRSAD